MPSDDLKQHATSEHDFYALLNLTPEASESDIKRAYRRTALKYHPDKNPDNPSAAEQFHLLTIALDVLSDPTVRTLYDNARAAKEAKKRQAELFQGKRRQMRDELEARENSATKRKRDGMDAETTLEREIKRIAEENKRRMREMMDKRNSSVFDGAKTASPEVEEVPAVPENAPAPEVHMEELVEEGTDAERTVKVRWAREGLGEKLDKERLEEIFGHFGDLDAVIVLKDKKKRIADGKKKMVATGVVMYKNKAGADAALGASSRSDGIWGALEFDSAGSKKKPSPSPQPTFEPKTTFLPKAAEKKSGVPTFSFSAAGKGLGTSLEQSTLQRLKEAEKRRLEEEIRRQEAALDNGENGDK